MAGSSRVPLRLSSIIAPEDGGFKALCRPDFRREKPEPCGMRLACEWVEEAGGERIYSGFLYHLSRRLRHPKREQHSKVRGTRGKGIL